MRRLRNNTTPEVGMPGRVEDATLELRCSMTLQSREVDVWLIGFQMSPAEFASARAVLAPEETTKLGRFMFERKRREFVTSRAGLRSLLARYCGVRPPDVSFAYGHFGKPYLLHDYDYRFNISHSYDKLLIAVSRFNEIGVDIERKPIQWPEAIARHIRGERVQSGFTWLSEVSRDVDLGETWVRKEAYLKARGIGLGCALGHSGVSPAPNAMDVDAKWSVYNINVGANYNAAVCVYGHAHRLRFGICDISELLPKSVSAGAPIPD